MKTPVYIQYLSRDCLSVVLVVHEGRHEELVSVLTISL